MGNHVFRSKPVGVSCALTLLLACTAGCSRPAGGAAGPAHTAAEGGVAAVAVSSPYLAAIVTDLAGDTLPLVALAEPSMCPGHFDLRPSLVRRAADCRLLVRFAFQQSLDARLGFTGRTPRNVVGVDLPGGMCEPASYVAACRQVAEAIMAEGLLPRDEVETRLAEVSARMEGLHAWAVRQVAAAGLDGAPVLASGHQAAFCRGLGLDVVGTFSAADTALPSQINLAVQHGREARVRMIVANLPEGRQLADALADRLGARVVVFGNFPSPDKPEAFDALVRQNVEALVEAAAP